MVRERNGTHWRAAVAAPLALAGFVMLVAAGALAACGGTNEMPPQPAVYGEAADGTTVPAAVGDVITVRLSENPSTGYVWTLTLSSGLERRSDELLQAGPSASPGLVGAAGTRQLTVAVTQAGMQTIKGEYARPWESGPAAQTFALTVDVK